MLTWQISNCFPKDFTFSLFQFLQFTSGLSYSHVPAFSFVLFLALSVKANLWEVFLFLQDASLRWSPVSTDHFQRWKQCLLTGCLLQAGDMEESVTFGSTTLSASLELRLPHFSFLPVSFTMCDSTCILLSEHAALCLRST